MLGIIAIVGGGLFVFYTDKTEKNGRMQNDIAKEQRSGNKDERAMAEEKDDAMTQEDRGAMSKKEDVTVKAGSYESYSGEKISMAATDSVVLFFHASWCPSCRALNADIEKNASVIPAGTTILKTDYDKETELKKKYGVTSQHTLVQVDKDGNLIKKWSGGSKLENLLSQIQ